MKLFSKMVGFLVHRDPNDVDVRAVYHQLVDTYVASDSDDDNRAGTSTGGITPSGTSRYVNN